MSVAPLPLNSLAEICTAFKRSRSTVLRWRASGAPIACDGGRYQAEYNALMAWLVEQTKKPEANPRLSATSYRFVQND